MRIKKKIFIFFSVFFLLVIILVSFIPNYATAQGIFSPASVIERFTGKSIGSEIAALAGNTFAIALKYFLYGIWLFIAWLLGIAGVIFDWVIDPKNIRATLGNPAVYESWKVVRDFFNLAFILVLLYSAFCTVFQIEKYHLKKILLTLVLMALLVNFSFPISRFIIDASNVTMYFLLNNLFEGADNVKSGAGIFARISAFSGITDILVPEGKIGDTSFSYLFAIIVFTFILMITLLVIAVMFVIRITALMILIIFSPIGFVAAIFPSTKHYADDWWKNLFKYSFFAPIMVFMIVIAINILEFMNESSGVGSLKDNVLKSSETFAADSKSVNSVASMAFFAVPIVILWMGMITAQKMGIAGADLITNKAKGFAGWAGKTLTGYRAGRWLTTKAAPYGIKAGLKKFDRDVLTKLGVSPRDFVDAWKERSKEVEDRIRRPGTGKWHDKLNKVFDKVKTNHEQLEMDRFATTKEKEFREVSTQSKYLNANMAGLVGKDSPEARARLKGIFRILYGQNDQDEIMEFIYENLDTKDLLSDGKTFRDFGFDKINSTVSDENITEAVRTMLKSAGAKDAEIRKELLDLGNVAAPKGGIGFGAEDFDPKTGEFVDAKEKGQMGYWAIRKLMTVGEAQGIPRIMHRNIFSDQHGGLNESGKAALRLYASPVATKHIARHKSDFYGAVAGDPAISNQMYLYSKQLHKGTARGYNEATKKYGILAQDKKQGIQAAAWTAALQKLTGLSDDNIRKNIGFAGFDPSQVNEIITASEFK